MSVRRTMKILTGLGVGREDAESDLNRVLAGEVPEVVTQVVLEQAIEAAQAATATAGSRTAISQYLEAKHVLKRMLRAILT